MKDFCTSPHHSANLAAARAWQAAIHAGDAKAVNCDCSEVAALAEAAAIRAAAVCVMPVIFEATESAQLMIDYKVTHAAGGDDMFSRLLEAGIRITGDAPIPFPDLQFCPYASFNSALADFPKTAFKRGIPLVAPLGMSEGFSFFSLRKMTDDQNIRTIGGGFPVNGKSKVRVRDPDTRKLLGFEQEGELEMWSPNIFVEYYGNNGAYTATFTESGLSISSGNEPKAYRF